jgi:hypothetical protein
MTPAFRPLEVRALFAWTLAVTARRHGNWGVAAQAALNLRTYICDPNPHVRSIAAGSFGVAIDSGDLTPCA